MLIRCAADVGQKQTRVRREGGTGGKAAGGPTEVRLFLSAPGIVLLVLTSYTQTYEEAAKEELLATEGRRENESTASTLGSELSHAFRHSLPVSNLLDHSQFSNQFL